MANYSCLKFIPLYHVHFNSVCVCCWQLKSDQRLHRMRRMGGVGLETAAAEAKARFMSVPSRVVTETRDAREGDRHTFVRRNRHVISLPPSSVVWFLICCVRLHFSFFFYCGFEKQCIYCRNNIYSSLLNTEHILLYNWLFTLAYFYDDRTITSN